ncbi:hypothetical protein GGR42_003364 [Saonia flava]|uniref:LTXXQ motif family protein n=1 Tax=Saonia flava TaxID=523696 RepID=A0A846QVB2_9FLAO|nr:hypothetical protein [Saonia flava]NJB72866.1 hypothetical protein [Saonia flava]
MKKVLVTLLVLVSASTMAQHRGQREGKKMAMMDMNPEQVATLQTKRMILTLELTKEQQEKVHSLNLENAQLLKGKMAEWKAKKENGEIKKPTLEERFAMQNERLDRQIAHQEKMKQILDEDQYSKWKQMRHKKGMHIKKKMHNKRKAK